ncbi:spore germination protein [Paenibacillus sp. V4I3]|uniref:Ger(x)C family spore germination protein n=1 Tax=unclassified Paenibacillus TaxID=185978 RepID=UPI002789280C|nr:MULTISPECIES: Ger(x)C family spore germination protein [unclassified Paenibacillus]MDQ0876264.1 spore germination protein [Paenibacillus sp. V4I3]MDQ0887703.1 spore germination protein [Paenibacillus sp. V4I9]
MRKSLLVLSVIVLLFPTGCVQKRILEELGLIVIVGYDPQENDRIKGTALLHQIDPEAKEKVQVVVTTGNTSKGVRNAQNREVSKRVVGGQLRIAMYNEKLARSGILTLTDTLSRDPSISDTMYVTVSKGSSENIITHRFPEISNIGTYLYKMIRQNIQGEQILSCTLHEFIHDVYAVGKDPVLPIVERSGDEISMHNTAMFQNDKMVGGLKVDEAFLLKLIRDRYRAGALELTLDAEPFKQIKSGIQTDKINIVIENITSSSKIKLVDPTIPSFSVHISMHARIQEISNEMNLGEPKVVHALESEIAKELVRRAQHLITKTQAVQSDPIGFGETYISKVRHSNLTDEKWREMYPKAKVQVDIKAIMVRSGVIE